MICVIIIQNIFMTQTMVSVDLMGGLGNQAFQIFTALAYAIRTNRKLILPYSDMLTVGIARNTYWDNLFSTLKTFTTINPGCGLSNSDLRDFPTYYEKEFHHEEIPSVDNEKVKLFGYFQSYKYFEMEKEFIFSFLRLHEKQEQTNTEFNELLRDHFHTVSMHFRLGDYKHIQHCHPLMSYEYYEKSFQTIYNKVENAQKTHNKKPIKVLYFCQEEDNEVVSEMIYKLNVKFRDCEFVKVNDNIPDWKQLLIMSCCNDNIIANSTFSWWGAYLNGKPGKMVCYPGRWFGPQLANKDTRDLFPILWTKIDT